MVRPKVEIDLSGPFFAPGMKRQYTKNKRRMLEGIAREGERLVKAGYPVETGFGQGGVVGRVASLGGKPWYNSAVVSQTRAYPWKNAGKKQYRGGKSEARHHMFRRVATATRRVKADLSEGLN